VPHGYVCGWPLRSGDMYGGSHYILSAAADMTDQGRAILEAAQKFGDGKTLPFAPCKKYYNPYSEINGDGSKTRMYACRLHNEQRKKRLKKEGGQWRKGEKHLDFFWTDDDEEDDSSKKKKKSKTKP